MFVLATRSTTFSSVSLHDVDPALGSAVMLQI